MKTAQIINEPEGQVILLPDGFRIDDKEVYIKKINDNIVLIPKSKGWDDFFEALGKCSDDFMENREQ